MQASHSCRQAPLGALVGQSACRRIPRPSTACKARQHCRLVHQLPKSLPFPHHLHWMGNRLQAKAPSCILYVLSVGSIHFETDTIKPANLGATPILNVKRELPTSAAAVKGQAVPVQPKVAPSVAVDGRPPASGKLVSLPRRSHRLRQRRSCRHP